MKLTVVVPICNVEDYIEECLRSLCRQTLQDVEFLCIDDGSTDASGRIADEYAKKDTRFRVIHKANEGYGKTMNLGLKEAHGEYVGIVESDDFVDPQMFEQLYRTAVTTGADIVKSNFYILGAGGDTIFCNLLEGCTYHKLCSAETDPHLLMTGMFIWTAIYRKSFLKENQIWFRETPSAAHQDIGFYLKTMALCRKIYLIPEGYLHYRANRKDSSGQHPERRIRFCEEFMDYWSFLRQRPLEDQVIGAAAAPNMFLRYRDEVWPVLPNRTRYHYMRQAWDDFQQLQASGLLIKKYWSNEDWRMLQSFLNHPERFYANIDAGKQEKVFLRKGLLASLRDADELYLYGAGQVAKWMLKRLRRYNVKVQGLLVEQLEKNPKQVAGIPVYQFADSAIHQDVSFIIIALSPRKESVQQNVYRALKDAGYCHVIPLTEELLEAIEIEDDV